MLLAYDAYGSVCSWLAVILKIKVAKHKRWLQAGSSTVATYFSGESAGASDLKWAVSYPCPVSEGPKESHLGGVW